MFEHGKSEFADTFIEYVKSLNRDIDALICAGDISTAGSVDSFKLGWEFLQTTKNEIKTPELLCVPGNHDHQSRPSATTFNPKEAMQYIHPNFPLPSFESNTFFWSWNWCHYESHLSNYNAILVNTSASHGFSEEYKHGRIPFKAIEKISEHVNSANFKQKPINILLCHHHPIKMEHVDDNLDYEAMIGGDRLIRMLCECDKGPWLIIHGHKHFADIAYAPSPNRLAPVIFSAGSLSAQLYPKIEDRTSNQFYILDIDLNRSAKNGIAVGKFESFESIAGRKWSRSMATNLPEKGGFGSQKTPNQIADIISKHITTEAPFLDEGEISELEPEIGYLTPTETRSLSSLLEGKGYKVMTERDTIVQVGKSHE